jgi:hypothetical protein
MPAVPVLQELAVMRVLEALLVMLAQRAVPALLELPVPSERPHRTASLGRSFWEAAGEAAAVAGEAAVVEAAAGEEEVARSWPRARLRSHRPSAVRLTPRQTCQTSLRAF